MDFNVRVTVDLGDRTMSLFSGMMAANQAITNATDKVSRVLEKYADNPAEVPFEDVRETEPQKRVRRARKTADPVVSGHDEAPVIAPEPETERWASEDLRCESGGFTHDDIRDLMAEVIGADDANRQAVLKKLTSIGARSVGAIKEEDVEGFYRFLETLKSA